METIARGKGWVWEREVSPPTQSVEALANLNLKSVKKWLFHCLVTDCSCTCGCEIEGIY